MTPNEEKAYEFFEQRGYAPDYYAQFNPFIYSVEHSFPLVNLGVKDHWAPNRGVQATMIILHHSGFRWVRDVTVCKFTCFGGMSQDFCAFVFGFRSSWAGCSRRFSSPV